MVRSALLSKENGMKFIVKAWVVFTAPLRWDLFAILSKVARSFAPGLKILGRVLITSGAAALGLKGTDTDVGLAHVNFHSVDTAWAIVTVGIGLILMSFAKLLNENGEDIDEKDEEG
jgi:hypothetical protein